MIISTIYTRFFFPTNKKRWAYIQPPPDLRSLFSATAPIYNTKISLIFIMCVFYSILYRGIHPDGEELGV